MDLHSLTTTPGARRRKLRVGRGMGSGHGKTCGRGHKGQMSRKGHKRKEGFEGGQMPLIRRIPKRGFKNPCRADYSPINVAALERFSDGDEITPAVLREAGLASGAGGVKILGQGELSRKLTVKANRFSQSAREKIEAAGGTCEVLED